MTNKEKTNVAEFSINKPSFTAKIGNTIFNDLKDFLEYGEIDEQRFEVLKRFQSIFYDKIKADAVINILENHKERWKRVGFYPFSMNSGEPLPSNIIDKFENKKAIVVVLVCSKIAEPIRLIHPLGKLRIDYIWGYSPDKFYQGEQCYLLYFINTEN